ncbi:MAG: FapA family protein [Lachnospiraceae bacterium]|nr:FapA family protein [Lachnospiraceae bacterium]
MGAISDQQRDIYLKEGFTTAQIDEIEAGVDAGLNTVVYAKKELMPQQMYQIRMGLAHGVDIHKYAEPEYDWFQLEEIRLGLEEKLDVSKYDSVELPSTKMHQMRRGLEDGMDLTDFLKYHADVMKELRKGLVSHIDLVSYVEAGYRADQLEVIRKAAEEGLDIFSYIDTDFQAVALEEIVEGLRLNLEVEVYAKTVYTWMQMEELRLGLMSGVDTSYYSSPLYNRRQMKEIRLGLEDGLEVTEYNSLMYPASDMYRIRKSLLDQRSEGTLRLSDEGEGADNRLGISVDISSDDMTAYIFVNASAYGNITKKDIMSTLRIAGVTKNIDVRLVDSFLAGKNLGERMPIATGRVPVDGQDGFFEYFFNTEVERVPKMLPDGSVDFQNTDWYEHVKRGQKLAFYHAAGKGEPGHTVTGKPIPPKRGKELAPLRCKGVLVSEDKRTYTSDLDGRVELSGNRLEVSKILQLKDVNMATGNVNFDGNVLISGTVSNGVTINAGGDVIIDGFVEDCTIVAKGDVILRKGVNGGGKGSITSGGSVEGKFFESVSVTAERSITVNYSLNSNMYSGDSITVFGKKGLILGGTVFAARDIKVGNVGNDMDVRTVIRLGISDKVREEQRRVENQLMDCDNKLKVLENGQRDFQAKFPAEIRNAMEMYIKIENAIYTINLDKQELLNRRNEIMRQIANTADAMLTVTGNLYGNILIEIDSKRIISTPATNVTVKKIDNRIGIFQNTKQGKG